jgi:hypothetical protein
MSLNTSNIIHIVAEVVTLLAITTYFMHQNRKMTDLIDSLTERLEEQEEKIEKHDKVISDILKTLKTKDGGGATPAPHCVGDKCVMPTPPPFASMLNSVFMENPFPQFFAQPPSHSVGTTSSVVEEADSEEDDEPHFNEEEEPAEEILIEEVQDIPCAIIEDVPQIVEIKDEPVLSTTEISKKKKKKKKKSNSVTDIDKELEDELNDLYKEEIMRNNS